VLVFGSRTLWHDLLRAGLVDELHVMIGAGLVGGGTPAFPDGVSEPLRLLEARRHDGSGIVVLRYARVPGD
jgi:dihydrofolate reductase